MLNYIIGFASSLGLVAFSLLPGITTSRLSLLLILLSLFGKLMSGKLNPIFLTSAAFSLFIFYFFGFFVYSISGLIFESSIIYSVSWLFYLIISICLFTVILNSSKGSNSFYIGYLTPLIFLSIFFIFSAIQVSFLGLGLQFRQGYDLTSQQGLNELLFQMVALSVMSMLVFSTMESGRIKKIGNFLCYLLFFTTFLVSLLSVSRQGLLLCLIPGIIFLLGNIKAKSILYISATVILISFFFANQIFEIYLNSYERLFNSRFAIVAGEANQSDLTRFFNIEQVLKIAFEYPFTGIGAGEYYKMFKVGTESGYLDLLADLGLIPGGFMIIAYCGVLLNIFLSSMRLKNKHQRNLFISIVLVLFIAPFANEVLRDPVTAFAFVITISMHSIIVKNHVRK